MEFIRAQRTKIPQMVATNLSNKTVLITGSNAGLGFEAARAVLLQEPGRLILAVRDLEKGKVAREKLEKFKAASTVIETRKLDQSSFGSVRAFVNELNGEPIDIAILNAGEHDRPRPHFSLVLTLSRCLELAVHPNPRRARRRPTGQYDRSGSVVSPPST